MPDLSNSPDIAALLSGLLGGATLNDSVANNSGYLRPQDALFTPAGQQWQQQVLNWYQQNAGGGWNEDGTARNGSIYGKPGGTGTNEQNIINWAMTNMGRNGVPNLGAQKTAQMTMADNANALARELQGAQAAAAMRLAEYNGGLQLQLQNGQINATAAQNALQREHEKALQAVQMAFNYAELDWQKEYGKENLQVLRDRLALDTELGRGQLALADRQTAVQEGLFQLEKEKFALDKNMKEADLRANPYNAVANALYTRGANVPQGQTEFGQPTTTLDNSGELPFLQVLNRQGGQLPMFQNMGSNLNPGGIGGNNAPGANKISQANFGNMSEGERGITDSLARYKGYNSKDYWNQMQNSWNTANQKNQNFGSTRMW